MKFLLLYFALCLAGENKQHILLITFDKDFILDNGTSCSHYTSTENELSQASCSTENTGSLYLNKAADKHEFKIAEETLYSISKDSHAKGSTEKDGYKFYYGT